MEKKRLYFVEHTKNGMVVDIRIFPTKEQAEKDLHTEEYDSRTREIITKTECIKRYGKTFTEKVIKLYIRYGY